MGQGGQFPPRIWSGGDANANCPPPRFCHIGTKMSVLWPSKYAKIRFRTPLGELTTLPQTPDPLVGWRGDTPPHIPSHSARNQDPPSTLAMRPPEVQPDLRLWVQLYNYCYNSLKSRLHCGTTVQIAVTRFVIVITSTIIFICALAVLNETNI